MAQDVLYLYGLRTKAPTAVKPTKKRFCFVAVFIQNSFFMNATMQMRIEMIRRTEQLLLAHLNIFDKDVRFQEVMGELQSRLAALELRIDALADSSAPLGPEKAKLRNTIIQNAMVLHEMIYHAAVESADLALVAAFTNTKNYQSLGFTNLVERVQHLLRKANTMKATLDKYSSAAPIVAELNAALATYESTGTLPKGTIAKNAIERNAIYTEIRSLTLFVRGPIKTVVRSKSFEAPDFFTLFKAYSRISGLSVHGSSTKKEAAEPAEAEEVAAESQAETAEVTAATAVTPEAAAPAAAATPANDAAAEPAKTTTPEVKATSVNKTAAKKAASTKTANGQTQAAEAS